VKSAPVLRGIRTRLRLPIATATLAVLAATWAYAELAPLDEPARSSVRKVLLLASALGIAAATLLSEWVIRRFANPLHELRRIADLLAGGEIGVRTRSRRNDEIGALGRAIDRLADQLADRFEAVRAHQARLHAMLDAMQEAVFVTDAEGRIVLTNAAFSRLTGHPGLGRTAIEAIRSPELHDAVLAALAGRSTRVALDLETERDARSLSAHVAPLPEHAGVVAVLHDITELRRLDAIRRDFVANASHELRTPLTAIRGFAETLRDGALDDPAIARRFVNNIVESAIRLQRLVDDLIELSRSESPEARMEIEDLDPLPVVSRVLRAFEQKAGEKGVQLAVEGAPEAAPIRGDARALDHVLMNLVDNALKYTPPGGRVTLRFRGDDPRALLIEVADTGPGIAAAHLPRIFERFYRADAGRARERGGTGLGLAIVKHLTQRMNGEVSVESRLGRGSTFTVRLPRAETRVERAPA
jgi:two-component system phosphate regulon sensor histidine kinase PhoR